ncbi:MAG: response regulator transcription factor [Bacteroidota bacterium]
MELKKTIAVVDDQFLFRQGLISLLKEYDELDVIMEASNGKELLEKLSLKQPDIVLLDLEMPVMDGIETTIAIKKNYPAIKIIILSMHTDDAFITHLLEKGASGFLPKDKDIQEVVEAINSVLENGYYFDARVSSAMLKGLVKSKKVNPSFSSQHLSEREVVVVNLICKEYTNKEIADKLCLSPRTIDSYRENILLKTGAKNTAGIVMYAVKYNLLD